MGCIESKKSRNMQISVVPEKKDSTEQDSRESTNKNSDPLFVIREESARNEESGNPSRIQSSNANINN